jgi:hypothetical protein
MKVFTILMLTVAAVYAWDAGKHHSCFVVGSGVCSTLASNEPFLLPIHIPIDYPAITAEECCAACAAVPGATTFGLFLSESTAPDSGGTATNCNEYQVCRCYSKEQTHILATGVAAACIAGVGTASTASTLGSGGSGTDICGSLINAAGTIVIYTIG